MTTNAQSSAEPRNELTARSLILGVIITVVFTAANVYFGLKAGLTFATSIPAAVISMAILRGFKGVTLQENNIVQTVASAAGTLSSIIFVLPGLIMIGWWTGFPYWVSFCICALGGILGVMYSIPLRRALVTNSDLPYPEGVACAEVLKVGAGEGEDAAAGVASNRAGLLAVMWGSIVSAVFAVVVATRLFASDVVQYFRLGGSANGTGGGVTGFDFFLSFALFGVGHLVGLWVGVAMLVGAIIGWGWGVPHFSALVTDTGPLADFALTTWSHKVRFVGAGTIAVAAVWTLLKLVKPVISGLSSAMAASRARNAGNAGLLPRTEQDIPIGMVGLITLFCLVPIGWLLADFASTAGGGMAEHMWLLVSGGLIYIVLMSFFVSAVCGYMAGLIGSSNSPLSGIGILVVIGAALLLVFGVRAVLPPGSENALVAFALFVTSIVFAAAAIANNNLQDLKTGQLVDATPSKQQWALVVGVIAGAAIIPPILDLLNHAYGFAGAPGPHHDHPLPAPQAGLISALAQGVIQNNIDWSLIQIGAVIGVVMIALDETLRRTTASAHLSPLAVGLGIYLPTQSTLMVVVGAVAGWWFDRRADRSAKNPEGTKQLGVLLASGMIVGEGLLGVAIAAFVAFSGKDYPLQIVSDSFAEGPALWIGGIAFAAVVYALYRWVGRLGHALPSA
ncbi:oligopeptide transporter, OPT family [Pseudolysobacter antarcticus]|uniref:Oligopeptide transporter, OPT family n=1 Tax=Pseudolysobacter antarcticus TaxID=2511995 RepID=A0A411HLA9_9GAMM|nr:oligopeptide transporter, OPT family [Pseudolysobacter antarcticus]QBB71283.1 oligopeptide transporter, OPT family [Pseudolysobacter antarcticus]